MQHKIIKALIAIHPNIHFPLKKKKMDKLAFVEGLLQRKEDGSLELHGFRKKTWSQQHINF